jgi:hypothetical protein
MANLEGLDRINLGEHHQKVLDFIRVHGPSTGGELNQALGSTGNPGYHRRAAELVRMGKLVEAPKRPCKTSGVKCKVFRLASASEHAEWERQHVLRTGVDPHDPFVNVGEEFELDEILERAAGEIK